MKNTLFRKAAVGAFAAAAAVGLSTLFATPASAHSVGPNGKADCGTDGKYAITWTVQNDYKTKVTLSNVTVGGAANTDVTTLDANGTGTWKATFKTSHAGNLTSVEFKGTATWTDNYSRPFATTVKLSGDCKPKTPPSSPPPSSPAPSPSKSVTPSKTPESSKSPVPSTSSTPSLPVTGSSSTIPMVGTGAALVAGGAVLIVTLRRRRKVQFTAE